MTSMSRRLRRRGGERGVTLILVALSIVALFTITAIVLDLSVVRQNRQADKSATDFAAAAGIRALGDTNGKIRVWKGICAARDYLQANNDELSTLTHVASNGIPIPDPCTTSLLPGPICGAPATWGTYRGLADGGRIRVTIQNGYDLGASGFAEDSAEYAADAGTDPCEHLAVIIEEREDGFFGGIVGSGGHTTTIRSVARLEQDPGLRVTAALVLLERTECNALGIGGATTDGVLVRGSGTSPGTIHSDSDGTGSSCNSSNTIFDVNGSGTQQIRAMRALLPVGSEAPGQITAVGASSPHVSAPSPEQVCAQLTATQCLGIPATGGGGVTSNDLVTRSVADDRYLEPVRDRVTLSTARFGWTLAQADANGYTTVAQGPGADFPCPNADTTFTSATHGSQIWIDCNNFGNRSSTFDGSVEHVVIKGGLSISGSNRVVRFDDPTTVFIEGDVSLSSPTAALRVNDDTAVSCAARYTAAPSARTELVIGGSLTTNGGLFRACQTTLIMTNGSGGDCPIPATSGTAPGSNTCDGNISSAGGSVVDWSAPNLNDVTSPSDTELENLEDLAFWTETSSGLSLQGNGNLTLAGIFFTPNADPFRIAGGGTKSAADAQFLTRKLEVDGNGLLEMLPDPQNAIQITLLGGFSLIR